MKNRSIIAIVAGLAGCANPGIVQLSPDTYMLARDDHAGVFGNKNKLKAEVIRDANAFAEKQGKVAIPLVAKEHPVGVAGDWASFEYQFRVVDKNDSEAQRTAIYPGPDFVIENNQNIRMKDETERKADLYTELMKLDDLRNKGLISDAEFEAQKQKLLNGAP